MSYKQLKCTCHCECQNLVQSINISGVTNEKLILLILKCIYLINSFTISLYQVSEIVLFRLSNVCRVIIYALVYMRLFILPFLHGNVHRL